MTEKYVKSKGKKEVVQSDNQMGWTTTLEKLLMNWSQQITINEQEYIKRGFMFNKMYYIFGIFSIVVQTGALTTLINVITTYLSREILIAVAVMQTLVLITNSVDKFFNFGSGYQKYLDAAKEHNALSKFIDTTLALPRKDRGDARETILSIRKQFTDLKTTSPDLPINKIIHKLDMCLYEDPRDACGNGGKSSPIRVGQSVGILKPRDSSPIEIINLPHIAEPVELPNTSDGEAEKGEYISHKTQYKIKGQLADVKKVATKEQNEKKGINNILQYQWSRLEQHGDDVV